MGTDGTRWRPSARAAFPHPRGARTRWSPRPCHLTSGPEGASAVLSAPTAVYELPRTSHSVSYFVFVFLVEAPARPTMLTARKTPGLTGVEGSLSPLCVHRPPSSGQPHTPAWSCPDPAVLPLLPRNVKCDGTWQPPGVALSLGGGRGGGTQSRTCMWERVSSHHPGPQGPELLPSPLGPTGRNSAHLLPALP